MDKVIFQIVVDNDVAATVLMNAPFSPAVLRSIAAYRSNPKFVEVTGLDIKSGDIWDGTNFYSPSVGI
jgi:hypothetical protein